MTFGGPCCRHSLENFSASCCLTVDGGTAVQLVSIGNQASTKHLYWRPPRHHWTQLKYDRQQRQAFDMRRKLTAELSDTGIRSTTISNRAGVGQYRAVVWQVPYSVDDAANAPPTLPSRAFNAARKPPGLKSHLALQQPCTRTPARSHIEGTALLP